MARPGHLTHNARSIGAEQVKGQALTLVNVACCLVAGVRSDLEHPVEGPKGRRQVGNSLGIHTDDDDAGKLAGQFSELALLPVAAVIGDDSRKGRDEAGAVVADDGEYESRHVLSLAGAPSPASWATLR